MRSTPEDPDDCWSSESEALFRAARSDNAPSAADRERVRRVLAQRLADMPALPVGTSVARQWGATVSRLLQLGVGVTFVVAVGLAVKHATSARSSRPETSSMRFVPAPEPAAYPQPAAADTRVPAQELVPQPPSLPMGAAGPQDVKRSDSSAQTSAARAIRAPSVTRQSRALSTPRSAAADESERASFGTISAPGRTADALASSPAGGSGRVDGTTVRAARGQQAAASTQPSVARSAVTQGDLAASSAGSDAADRDDAQGATALGRGPGPQPTAANGADGQSAKDARAEAVFMRKIQAATLAAQPERVLALCEEHERRWAHGTFVQEREGLRAMASCRTAADASGQQARRFLEQYPRTAIAPRVRDACKLQLKAAR